MILNILLMYGALATVSRENKMKTIRIRKFIILFFLLLLLLPWIFLVAAHLIGTKTVSFQLNDTQKRNLSETVHLIETNTENWTNQDWQHQIQSRLKSMNMDVKILSATDQEIYRSTSKDTRTLKKTEQFTIIQDGKVLGKVFIYLPNSRDIQIIAAFTGLLLAFFIIAYEMRKHILKPLEKMSLAARQIAKGDLDVQLPNSRITEIADVRDGFKIMVGGLNESFRKQVALEEERRFVISAVAHDLRTPLFALRGYLDGLEQGIAHSPEKVTKYIVVCKEKSAQLDRLVEDLFTFTKMEYLKMEIEKNRIDLVDVIQKSIDTLYPIANEKQISFNINFSPEDCIIIGDVHLLERAMTNFLDNAVRHTPCHGKIFVKCHKETDKAAFTIHDTGGGFELQDLQRVFEPLYRSEKSRNRSTGGVGLGLTISQRIIKLHGGDIAVDNHSHGGGLVTGWLPIAKVN